MRKILLITLIFMSAISAFGQDSTKVKEPEFVNNYCLMNTDSTFTILPKENGTIKKHQNKVSKWTKIIGNVSTVAMAAGSIVGISAGSAGAVIDGMRTVSTAASVGQVADAANVLAGAEGMDIAFDGAHSEYVIPKDMKDINIVVKGEDNSQDPMELYRIVRFNSSKKDGRITWPIGKENEFIDTDHQGYLQENTNYLFVKRFTAKEEKRRLQCGIYLSSDYPEYRYISTQNKLNYIKCSSIEEVYGLYVLLNSTIYDQYYRILNGSTQVNSTEINNMPVPSKEVISEMGKELVGKALNQSVCDKILRKWIN